MDRVREADARARASSTTCGPSRRTSPVGLPQPQLFTVGSAAYKQELDQRKANANITVDDFAVFENNPVPVKVEPPNAQAIYAVLDAAMSGGPDRPERQHRRSC